MESSPFCVNLISVQIVPFYTYPRYVITIVLLHRLLIMFVLVSMKDTVRIPPWLFNLKLQDAAVDLLNKKLSNKVCKK